MPSSRNVSNQNPTWLVKTLILGDCGHSCTPGQEYTLVSRFKFRLGVSTCQRQACQYSSVTRFNASSANSTSCEPCPEGYYQNLSGKPLCNPCDVGTFCNSTGCSHCEDCDQGTEALVAGSNNCTLCKPGSYKESTSAENCKICKHGWFTTKSGSLECTECPVHYFCPTPDRDKQQCSPQALCPPGSAVPGWCPSPLYVKESDYDCKASSELIGIVVGSCIVFCLLVAFAAFKTVKRYRKRSQTIKIENAERRQLVSQEESSPPVYTGL
uniref:Tyrosine-protein kinase ephrin type A/B receptor-like domain-containing protein n=1 Tax=Biomphalaria glabrata TaxID=6526 RepID=A0A2C9MAM1_BIOGL